jgi:3-oxo-5-alpha-steroid 4-dehydrogenase 1
LSEQAFFHALIAGWFSLAVVVFLSLLFFAAPYGRYLRSGWGPAVNNRLGWVIMEAAAPLAFAVFFVLGNQADTITRLVFLGLWEAHYIHRAFIYPFSLRRRSQGMPLIIVGSGLLFNIGNAYLNGRYIFSFSVGYANQWLGDPRFIAGVALFITGFIINRQADLTLHNLGKSAESGYKIPYGGLYRWISCPNYLGEVIIWLGWALATWSLPGLAFAVWTAANLVPRARSHHAWYRQNFPDYPPRRRALLPGIW